MVSLVLLVQRPSVAKSFGLRVQGSLSITSPLVLAFNLPPVPTLGAVEGYFIW